MGVVLPAGRRNRGGDGRDLDSDLDGADGASDTSPREARVARYFDDKRFGFVRLEGARGRQKDVFFHANALPAGSPDPRVGDRVVVTLSTDRSGKRACTSVSPTGGGGGGGGDEVGPSASVAGAPSVTLPCFSMNMPFAALVACATACGMCM